VRQYREAIVTFTRALAVAPDHPVLYRHRGHRYLSVRQLDSSVLDLERGAHLDTANHDIWYHLGVARFARGEYAEAVSAFEKARGTARNAEGRISSTDWLWMSLRRAGRTADAALALAMLPDRAPDGGAAAYWRRLQLYQGLIAPDQALTPADTGDIQIATLAFGIGNWHLVHADTTRAREWFRRSVASGGWPAFGFICAEADLRRLGQR
jgi:tetratricopeptide (TPR) repeat protein